ncbi:ceramide synthase 4-like isoform 1-T1 [Liasis olivaceus]
MLPFEVKRMDLREQIVHHAASLFLIGFSYCANYIRIGSVVMILHDIPDSLLHFAKMFNYLKWQKTSYALFFIFTAVYLFASLVIFPCKIFYNTYYYPMELTQPFFGYYFFNAILIVLYLLDLFWLSLVIRMVYRFLIHGTVRTHIGHLGRWELKAHVGEGAEDQRLLSFYPAALSVPLRCCVGCPILWFCRSSLCPPSGASPPCHLSFLPV